MSAKITELLARSALQAGDFFVIADADEAINYKVRFDDLVTAIEGSIMPAYTLELDTVSASRFYVGEAIPGSSLAAALWRIYRVDGTTDLSKKFADGEATFTKVWNDRASYAY
jgi:hypothetical protein